MSYLRSFQNKTAAQLLSYARKDRGTGGLWGQNDGPSKGPQHEADLVTPHLFGLLWSIATQLEWKSCMGL